MQKAVKTTTTTTKTKELQGVEVETYGKYMHENVYRCFVYTSHQRIHKLGTNRIWRKGNASEKSLDAFSCTIQTITTTLNTVAITMTIATKRTEYTLQQTQRKT